MNSVIYWQHVTTISIIPAIIWLVHKIAKQEKMPQDLKIYNKAGTMLNNSAWVARVDYYPNKFDKDKDIDNDKFVNNKNNNNNKDEEAYNNFNHRN